MMQGQLMHLRLEASEYESLKTISYAAGLSATAIAALLLKAGVAALINNDGRFRMPLELSLKTDASEFAVNEPKYPRSRRH